MTASDKSHGAERITVLLVDQGASFGGSLVVAANLARSLDASRFRCIIAAEADREFVEYRFHGAAEVHLLPHAFNYATWERVNTFAQRVPTVVARKAFLYGMSAVRFLVNSLYAARVLALVFRERVDLIHLNNGIGNVEAFLVSVLTRRPHVVHVHGLDKLGTVERFLFRRAKRVISISQAVSRAITDYGVEPARLTTLPNPVVPVPMAPSDRSDVRERYCIPSDSMVVALFGRVVRWKGQLEFLRAAADAVAAIPGALIMIVGDAADGNDEYSARVLAFVDSRRIRDRVIFTGFVDDVDAVYAAVDVVVHASIEPEPFGLVITEAMSHGIPVIASTLGAPVEIIEDGVTGFLVNPADTAALAESIGRLLRDPQLRSEIGARGRGHVLKTYAADRYARAMEEVYLEALKAD